ncbi:DUF4333 domain-containing protein [Saccharomonospora sp. NPDC046836]|uniref:DUF4333 domain-containing protein n=1 Tax=Saccharomonospora sp. NPDC046836 TaxID=3156921 RepID=UPI0033F68BEF
MLLGAGLSLAACGGDEPAAPQDSLSSSRSPASSTAETEPGSQPVSTTTSLLPVPKLFDAESMQASVQQILTESYRIEGVESVTCPADQPVEPGLTFECTAQIAGDATPVPITVQDGQGHYEVGYPQ